MILDRAKRALLAEVLADLQRQQELTAAALQLPETPKRRRFVLTNFGHDDAGEPTGDVVEVPVAHPTRSQEAAPSGAFAAALGLSDWKPSRE